MSRHSLCRAAGVDLRLTRSPSSTHKAWFPAPAQAVAQTGRYLKSAAGASVPALRCGTVGSIIGREAETADAYSPTGASCRARRRGPGNKRDPAPVVHPSRCSLRRGAACIAAPLLTRSLSSLISGSPAGSRDNINSS